MPEEARIISPSVKAAALLIVLAPPAAAEPPPRASLVEARLTEVQDISGQPGAPVGCIDEHNRRCDAGSSYRVTFAIDRTLTGPPVQGVARRDQISAQPLTGLTYLLVLSPAKDGPRIEWAGFSRYGLCMDEAALRSLGLADEMTRHPCRTP